MRLELWTDGSCVPNPGEGSWAALLRAMGPVRVTERELSGYDPVTTNNAMELTALVRGLEALTRPVEIVVFSDSRYVVDAIERGWLANWVRDGAAGLEDRPNGRLWRRASELLGVHAVTVTWVRGHAGEELNERVHVLAASARLVGDGAGRSFRLEV